MSIVNTHHERLHIDKLAKLVPELVVSYEHDGIVLQCAADEAQEILSRPSPRQTNKDDRASRHLGISFP